MPLVPGDVAPDFTLPTDGKGLFSLTDARGRWLILYFYPKDDTEVCTQQACDFRDSMARLTPHNVTVVGISRDTVRKHDNFKKKYDLNFTIAADVEHIVCEAYQVWVEKSMYGRKYMGIERSTFIIDPDGIIRTVFHKVKAKGHVDAIIDELKGMNAMGVNA